MSARGGLEEKLADALERVLRHRPEREYRFCLERRWRFDLAFPSEKVAVEIEGVCHAGVARHRADCEKFNAATKLGWSVLRYPASAVKTERGCQAIAEEIAEFVAKAT